MSQTNFASVDQSSLDLSEVTAALSALVGLLHADPDYFLGQPLSHWAEWLATEDYSSTTLADWFLELSSTSDSGLTLQQLSDFYGTAIDHDISTGAFLESLAHLAPEYFDFCQARVNDLVDADEQAKQVAGGKSLDVRPAYLASGLTLAGVCVAWKKGYLKKAYNWTKESISELWTTVKSTAADAKTDLGHDITRDENRPLDAVRQAEFIEPDAHRLLDVENLERATVSEIRRTAEAYAKTDIASIFSESKIANSAWYAESKGLIGEVTADTVRIDKTTYRKLKEGYTGDDFNSTELAKRFGKLDLQGIDTAFEKDCDRYATSWVSSSKSIDILKDRLGVNLQRAYEHVLEGEVRDAAALAKQDVIVAVKTESEFREEVRQKAAAACQDLRAKAVNEFNADMLRAQEAAKKAGVDFVDVEKRAFAAAGEDFVADFDSIA